jgi:hypothetical protein
VATAMNSEESYNPYLSLNDVPTTTQLPQNAIPSVVGAQTIESPPITKKCRALVILVIPAMFLFIIAVLLCTMLL